MAMQYTKHDLALLDKDYTRSAILILGWGSDGLAGFVPIGPGLPVPIFTGSNAQIVEFQFPLKIPSDNRGGEWNSENTPGSEPVVNYIKSGPREFMVKTHYVVDSLQEDSAGTGGAGPIKAWTPERIHLQLNRLRGYFARMRFFNNIRSPMVCGFRCYNITGPEIWSCYIRNVGVSYSDRMVTRRREAAQGGFVSAFPVRTDVTIDIRLWVNQLNDNDGTKLQDVIGLKPQPQPEDMWY